MNAPAMQDVNLTINGEKIGPISVPPTLMMVSFLHEYLNKTGTKFGCGAGICHACTVIVDNDDGTSETMRTCIIPAIDYNGKHIRTIEGHAETDDSGEIVKLSPVQQAYCDGYSFQCGWCTSGMTNEGTVLVEKLKKQPVAKDKVEDTILQAMGSHVCRCTGYTKYYGALKKLILETPGLTL